MMCDRRKAIVRGSAMLLGVGASLSVRAQGYPNKSITLVVPSPPGGNLDIVGRTLAGPLGSLLGQTIVVDNRGGGGGAVGAGSVARAPADGYTLMIGVPGHFATLPAMVKTPYSYANFKPIGIVSKTAVTVVARKSDSRLKSFAEFSALAKSKPGAIAAGHPGPGLPNHLALLQLEELLKAQFNAVSYRGSGPALLDLLGGHIDVHFDQVSSSMPYIKAGKLQALAVIGPDPEPLLPGVPTLGQLGLGTIDATTYAGVFAPAGLPSEVLAKLSDAVQRACRDEKLVAAFRELGSSASGATGEQFSQIIEKEAVTSAELVRTGRLKAE